MKKLKLKALALGASEMLSREQLKNVFGGDGSGSGSGSGGGSGVSCGTYPNCTTDKCTANGKSGTCGKTTSTKKCTCGTVGIG